MCSLRLFSSLLGLLLIAAALLAETRFVTLTYGQHTRSCRHNVTIHSA